MGFKIENGVLLEYTKENGDAEITVPDGVTEIRNSVFSQTDIKTIILPSSLKRIGRSAFWQAWSSHINIPESVTEIEELAFCACTCLEELRIPSGVKEIGENTFWHCSSVKVIPIPDTIEKVDKTAFEDCWSAFEIYNKTDSIILPFVSDWGASSAVNAVNFICAMGTDAQESVFGKIRNPKHKIPLAVWAAIFHNSNKGKKYVQGHIFDAAMCLIKYDNYKLLKKLFKLINTDDTFGADILSSAKEAGAEKCCKAILIEYPDADKATEKNNVLVDESWSITVPEGYICSTDSREIGHRIIVLGLDDGTLDFISPFDSTVNFTAIKLLDNDLSGARLDPTEMIMENEDREVIKQNKNIAISFCSEDSFEDGGKTVFKFNGIIITRKNIYKFQYFDSESKTEKTAANKLRDILKSIRANV